jgi:hypothetical protein
MADSKCQIANWAESDEENEPPRRKGRKEARIPKQEATKARSGILGGEMTKPAETMVSRKGSNPGAPKGIGVREPR